MLKGLKAECPAHKMSPDECSCSTIDQRIGDLIRAVVEGAVTVYRQLGNYTTGQLHHWWEVILEQGQL